MNKPGIGTFVEFLEIFRRLSRKEQYLVPYLISSHPGWKDHDMLELKRFLKKNNLNVEQVQDFIPSPMTASAAMYHTGKNPYTGAQFLRWIKTQYKDSVRLIPVEEADYFKAEDKYTAVITKEGESLIKKSIKELARELDPAQFWQIHRGTIVNVSKIDRVSRSLTGRGILKLKERPELLTVSRNYLHLFKQM